LKRFNRWHIVPDMDAAELEAVVVGRVCVDLYPMQLETPLEQVEGFHKYVGGFAGNVATGLARLGVRTAIVSAVGDDGHGRYIRSWLEAQGVDCRWLGIHPTLRTALAFCEAWPPDRFPITFYRTPTCPDWELTAGSLDLDAIRRAPLAYVSGTGFAVEPSRLATIAVLEARAGGQGTSILDLDWRPVLWGDPAEYAACMRTAARLADVALGGDDEIEAAMGAGGAAALLDLGVRVVAQKHGPRGATLHMAGRHTARVVGQSVEVVNGLGAGDAFAAAFGWRLLRGDAPAAAAEVANRAGAHVAGRLGCSIAMPEEGDLL
jgi:5-dehydro-2-deoxygluconokinase